MPRIKRVNIPTDWQSIVESDYDEILRHRPLTPPKDFARKILNAEGARDALEVLAGVTGSLDRASIIFAHSVARCAFWSRISTKKRSASDVRGNQARARAKQLRAAKLCPLIDENGAQILESAAQYYDWVATIPPRLGAPRKSLFMKACALELADLFIATIGTPTHRAVCALLLATFGKTYEEDSAITIISQVRKEPDILEWAKPPDKLGLKPVVGNAMGLFSTP